MPGSVRRAHAQHHHKRGVIRSSQIIANQPPRLVVRVEECEPETSTYVGAQEEQDEPGAGLAAGSLHVLVGEDADEDAQGDERAVGDLHESGDEGREAEALDDYCAKVRDACAS